MTEAMSDRGSATSIVGNSFPESGSSVLWTRVPPQLELAPLAAYDMYDNAVPSAGIIAAVGRVPGRERHAVANDATVKGGTDIR